MSVSHRFKLCFECRSISKIATYSIEEKFHMKGNESVAKIFRFRPPCSSKLQSIVLEADFYSRGSKLFIYVNPFATFK